MDIKIIEFYNKTMDEPLVDICLKVVDIANYYIIYSNEASFKDINITKKGIDIILNVFSMILLYTKNIELTVEYTNNSIYYFIEYVSQISNKNSEFVFVNLTIKDAILYVYRKSIFEINEKYKSNFVCNPDESIYFNVVNSFIKTYSVILKEFVGNSNYSTTNLDDIKIHLYKINAYIMTFFKTIEIYTDTDISEHADISPEDRCVLYNVTYTGVTSIYEQLIGIDDPEFSKTIQFDDKNSYDFMCERIKKTVTDYSDILIGGI